MIPLYEINEGFTPPLLTTPETKQLDMLKYFVPLFTISMISVLIIIYYKTKENESY